VTDEGVVSAENNGLCDPLKSSFATMVASQTPAPPPYHVGETFVKQYYNVLLNMPHSLHRFYKEESSLTRCPDDDRAEPETVHGQGVRPCPSAHTRAGSEVEEVRLGTRALADARALRRLHSPDRSLDSTDDGVDLQLIEAKINSLGFKDCDANIDFVDCQLSMNEGVMVMVTGSLSNAGQSPRRFNQSFFLARQPNGYYVLNDIFRYLGNVLSFAHSLACGRLRLYLAAGLEQILELVRCRLCSVH
jgi:hypothetical protein